MRKSIIKAVNMSIKIFNNFICRNLKNPKHFHLYPSHRSRDISPFFTKHGDGGESKIYAGSVSKDHIIFEAIGVTEELNASIGFAREFVRDDERLLPLAEKLRKIQLVLIDLIDIIRSLHPNKEKSDVNKSKPPHPPTTAVITNADIIDLETTIAHYSNLLPPPEKTVIPGGGKASASLHVARNVCRRCERILVHIFKDMDTNKNLIAYINRLSSYLFQAARISAKFSNRTETVYKPNVKGSPPTGNN